METDTTVYAQADHVVPEAGYLLVRLHCNDTMIGSFRIYGSHEELRAWFLWFDQASAVQVLFTLDGPETLHQQGYSLPDFHRTLATMGEAIQPKDPSPTFSAWFRRRVQSWGAHWYAPR